MERFEAVIAGRVQGVFFRDFTRHTAARLGIVGFVRNLEDGSVHVVAEGASDKLETFLEHLREGPPDAKVHAVEISWHGPSGEHVTFVIAETSHEPSDSFRERIRGRGE